MDNSNEHEKTKDPSETGINEQNGADEPSLPDQTAVPEDTMQLAAQEQEIAADKGDLELSEPEQEVDTDVNGDLPPGEGGEHPDVLADVPANEPENVPAAQLSGTNHAREPDSSEDGSLAESDDPASETGADRGPDDIRTALVAVRGQNRSAHFNAGEHTLKPGDEVVIQTEQGKSIGEVLEPPVILGCRGCKHLTILRKATPEEISRDAENRDLEKKASEYCTKTIEEWEIPMRLVQVEFHLDRSKAVFYFTAEKRVDFRELVRTLAREFSTRIEMRQIGIRDEARLLGGVGPCGMAFCCSTFLKEFAPISVKMAKEQNVILNPNKISGGCGRLLCCLNYEYDQYKEASRGVPKVGKKINLPEGSGKVRSVDIFARTVTIDMTDDKPMVIDIDELREKMK